MNKLCIFDFDSTLMDCETLDEIAKEIGIEKQIQEITNQGMNGNLSFYDSINQRVKLLKGIPEEKAIKICQNLPVNKGAKELIKHLKNNNFKIIIFSGGFNIATKHYMKELNFDCEFSNILVEKDGILTGEVTGEMMYDNSKGTMLEKIQRLLNISKENTIVIGDGANDLSMFKHAGTKIAYCAKPFLEEHADIKIKERNLNLIIEHIK